MSDNYNVSGDPFGSEFDLDFDLDPTANKDTKSKKSILKEFGAGFWDGFKTTATQRGQVKRLLKSILPNEYRPAFHATDRLGLFGENLYDKLKENTKTGVNEVKKLTGDVMTMYGNKLPESVVTNIEAWANDLNEDDNRSYSSDSGSSSSLDIDSPIPDSDDISSVLKMSTDLTSKLSQAQHNEAMAQLAAISVKKEKTDSLQTLQLQNINRLMTRAVGYQESITATYQRRSLELQYRHYKLAVSSAKLQEHFYKKTALAFDQLIKNTVMSDLEKAHMSRGNKNIIARQMGSGLMSGGLSKYGSSLLDSMMTRLDGKSNALNGSMSTMAPMLRNMLAASRTAKQSGMKLGARDYGGIAGSGLVSMLPFLFEQTIKPRMGGNSKISSLGSNASYFSTAMPGLINNMIRNRESLNEQYNPNDKKNKWYSKAQARLLNPMLNDLMFQLPTTKANKTRIQTHKASDLTQPAQFDLMTRRSIVEVIPALLTSQLTELKKIRTGKDKVDEVEWNHRLGSLTSKEQNRKDIETQVFDRNEFRMAASSFNDMVDTIDPEKELTPNARLALAMRLAKDTNGGGGFNINNYITNTGWDKTDKKTVNELIKFIKGKFNVRESTGLEKKLGKYTVGADKESTGLRSKMAQAMQSQTQYMPEVEQTMNSLALGGNRDQLRDMGLIKRVDGEDIFNHDAYWEMMQGYLGDENYRSDLDHTKLKPHEQRLLDRKMRKRRRIEQYGDDLGAQGEGAINDLLGGRRGGEGSDDAPESVIGDVADSLSSMLNTTMASVRDSTAATAAGIMALVTGDKSILKRSETERAGWLSSFKGKYTKIVEGSPRVGSAIRTSTAGLTSTITGIKTPESVKRFVSASGMQRIKIPAAGETVDKLLSGKAGESAEKGSPIKEERELSITDQLLLKMARRGNSTNEDPDGDGVRNNSWRDLMKKRSDKKAKDEADKAAKAADDGKDGKEKEKPKSIFGLLSGLFGSVTGLVGDIKSMGILGSLASFLGLGWVGKLATPIVAAVGWLGKALLGKGAIDDIDDVVGDLDTDEGDGKKKKGKKGRRGRRGRGGRGGRRGGGANLSDAADVVDDITGDDRGRGGRPKKRGLIRRIAGGIAKEPGKMFGRAKWLMSGGVKTVAKVGGGAVGAALAAAGMYSAYSNNDMGGVAEAGGGGIGALGGAAIGASIGSVVPIVGTAIGGIVGGAIGGLAGTSLGRGIYNFFNKPGLLQQMRLRQYGIPDNNSDHTEPVAKLEAAVEKFVKLTDSGKASFDGQLPMVELAKMFVTDPNDKEKVQNWATWFTMRFKPVYLTHRAVAKQLFPNTPFNELDKSNDDIAKYEMASRARQFDQTLDNPYRFTGYIFDDLRAVDANETEALVKSIVDELKAKAQKKGLKQDAAPTTSSIASGNAARPERVQVKQDILDAINPTGESIRGLGPEKGGWYSSSDKVTVSNLLGPLLPKPGQPMDDFTAARMKLYGLKTLDIEKVSALLQLELVVNNSVTYSNNSVSFTGNPSDIFNKVGSIFGYGYTGQKAFGVWNTWFTQRFLPVYMTFANYLYQNAGMKRPTTESPTLPVESKYTALVAMNQAMNKDASVWSITTGAWGPNTANTDSTSIASQLENLKQMVRTASYSAAPVRQGSQSKDGTTDKEWRKDSNGNMVSNTNKLSNGQVVGSNRQETLFNPTTGATSSAYGGGAMGGVGAGAGNYGVGANASTAGGGAVDKTGQYTEPKVGPGTDEGIRVMLRMAKKMGITDKTELAMLLAQTAEESGGFRLTEENLRYRPETMMKVWPNRFPTKESAAAIAQGGPVAIANSIYGKRMGNDQPGDGYKFRGRGFIQLTGKDNYQRAAKDIGADIVSDPDKVAADPEMAAKTAIWYWNQRSGLRGAAQKGDITTATKLINGGLTNLEKRKSWFNFFSNKMKTGEYDGIVDGSDVSGGTQAGDDSEASGGALANGQRQTGGPALPSATPPPLPAAKPAATPAPSTGSMTGTPAGVGNKPATPSTTSAPPSMRPVAGPSATAAKNAGSPTPSAPNSTASADDMFNKNNIQQPQSQPSVPAKAVPVKPVEDPTQKKSNELATENNNQLSVLNANISKLISALTGGGNGGNNTPAPVSTRQASTPVGGSDPGVNHSRNY